MEGNFESKRISCLDTLLQQVQNSEQTMEIKVPEGMPDIGRILTAWGQPVLRSKEWREDSVSFSGGMMVWVLYAPEDGSSEQCLEGWIPFQMRWELPENAPEGTLRIHLLTRFVDARNTSPRKILVRAGMGALAEAFAPIQREITRPTEIPSDTALLENTYPVRLYREAGEKIFPFEEQLHLPESAPTPDKLITWQLNPRVTDQRVLADKAVLRGNGNLHILYRSESGQIHSWDFDLPFSQYIQLQGEYGSDARLDTAMMPTSLELEQKEDGQLEVRGGMTAQYLLSDKQPLTVVEDAYSPVRNLDLEQENLMLPVVLENRHENLYGEQTIPARANIAADVQFLPDFPRQRRTEEGAVLEYPGQFQILYYGEDGRLEAATARWEGNQLLPADGSGSIMAVPMAQQPQAVIGSDRILMKTELPVELTTTAEQNLSMVTDVIPGEARIPDPNRPSLILRRAGVNGLWDIAKETGSTMEAIRRANGLEGEPAPDQMLLIPVS